MDARYSDIFDNIPQMLWIGGGRLDGHFCNKALNDFLGVDSGAAKSTKWLKWIHPNDRDTIKAAWRSAAIGRASFETEIRLFHCSGRHRWVLARGAPIIGSNARVDAWLGTIIDTDQSKLNELQLALNAERFRALHEASSMVLWIATPDGGVAEQWGWTNLTNQKDDAFRGWGWLDTVDPRDKERIIARWTRCLASGETYREEFRLYTQTGGLRWVEAEGVPLRSADGTIREWVGRLSDIHERKQAEHAMRVSEERLRLAVESTRLGIWDADLVSGERNWNEQARAILGLPASEEVTRESFRARVHPEDRDKVEQKFFVESPTDGSVYSGEYRIVRHGDSAERWIAATGRTICDGNGQPVRKIGTVRDVSSEKQSIAALETSEKRLRLALQAARMIAWEQDLTTDIVTRSTNARDLLGIGSGPLAEFLERIHPEDRALRRDFLRHSDGSATIEVRYHGPNDTPLWLAIRGERSADNRLIGVTFDITAQKLADQEVQRMAHEDSLTGLVNRTSFQLLVEQHCSRREESPFSVILLDLDHFKDVNDMLGHDAGDDLLKEAASRMVAAVGEDGLVARFGGDEFAVLLDRAGLSPSVAADRILVSLRSPMAIHNRSFPTRASIGIATYPQDGGNAKELLKSADMALYRAKAEGRDRLAVYTPAIQQEFEKKFSILEDVRRGLKNNEFKAYYQPKISLASGELAGFEALARWQHPERGLCTPGYFGAAFDDPQLARGIGERILAGIMHDLAIWRRMGHDPGRVAINISPSGFRDPALADLFFDRLRKSATPANSIEIEITEAVFLDHMSCDPALTLKRFHDAGVTIALDDFGTGFASLSHLKRFPIDHIKIDMSFIRDIENNRSDDAIVSAIIHLGHRLNMRITAEGVETVDQANKLRNLGCDNAQGFLYAPALSPEDALRFMQSGSAGLA